MNEPPQFAVETCLSQGDILRLTESTIDWQRGVIVPEGGRKKTHVFQVSPLTNRCREILEEIRAERKASGEGTMQVGRCQLCRRGQQGSQRASGRAARRDSSFGGRLLLLGG